MKIAFFDSGIGGLTVLKEALRLYPNEDYIYFADSDHAPYGARSQPCLLYTSPSPRDRTRSRMPSSA